MKAVKYGRVLVVDEADKAPTEVTCILKSLAYDKSKNHLVMKLMSVGMTLSDGRTICEASEASDARNIVPIHPK